MINTDEYVPFETAELLKKHGFPQDYYCYPVYYMNGDKPKLAFEGDDDFPYSQNECVAPTIATALKWLRETHGLYADVFIIDYAPEPWVANIHKYNNELEMVSIYRNSGDFFATFEGAAHHIIRVCLEKFL